MSNSIVSFQFDSRDVRFVDGKPIANDVAAVLGYADPAKTISTKVFPKNRSVTKMVTVDGKLRDVTVLEEPGIYQLIFSSKLESAERFQQWVFSEVLPSIRKTGSYSAAPEHQIPKTYAEALIEAGRLALENEKLSAKIEKDAPLVAYAESVLQYSEESIEFNDFAKMIGTGRTRLFRMMRDCGVIMQNSTLPYQKFIEAGYFEVSQEIDTRNGKLIPYALVTAKGQIWLHDRLKKHAESEAQIVKAIVGTVR